jgi:putative DNA primase/helicase
MTSDLPAPPVESGVYPEDRVKVSRWLTWKEADDGRKIPRAPYHNSNHPDRYVSAQDPTIWTDFDTAAEWAEKLPNHQLAYVIPDRNDFETDLVVIDYDDARDPDTREIHPVVHEHLTDADSYADVSPSRTGIHVLCRGRLPEHVKTISDDLPEHEAFPDASIEVYESARFITMTGTHIAGTPTETHGGSTFLDGLVEDYATVSAATPDEVAFEPKTSRENLENVETTSDIQDVFDAIQHVRPGDISLRSTVTEERADGTLSLDPSWANSSSGTRLAQLDEGWVYRDGLIGLDALQVVALEEGIITDERDYPSGKDFWEAVDELRARGAHIPEYKEDKSEAAPSASDWSPDTDRVPSRDTDTQSSDSTSSPASGSNHSRDWIRGRDSPRRGEGAESLYKTEIDRLEAELEARAERIDELEAELDGRTKNLRRIHVRNSQLEDALENDVEVQVRALDADALVEILDEPTLVAIVEYIADHHADEDGNLDLSTDEDSSGRLDRLKALLRSDSSRSNIR